VPIKSPRHVIVRAVFVKSSAKNRTRRNRPRCASATEQLSTTQLLIDPRHPAHKRLAIKRARTIRVALIPDTLQSLRLEPRLEPYRSHEPSVQSRIESGFCQRRRPGWRWRRGYGWRHVYREPAPTCILTFQGHWRWRFGRACAHVSREDRVVTYACRWYLFFSGHGRER